MAKKKTVLTLNQIPDLPWGHTIPVTGRIVDLSGKGIAGLKIEYLRAYGPTPLPDVTDNDGYFSTTMVGYDVNSSSTPFGIEMWFRGDASYDNSASSRVNYYILAHRTLLTLGVPERVSAGKEILWTAVLKDKDSIPGVSIRNKTVHFDGTAIIPIIKTGQPINTALTDHRGVAVLKAHVPSTPGTNWTSQAHYVSIENNHLPPSPPSAVSRSDSQYYNDIDSAVKLTSTVDPQDFYKRERAIEYARKYWSSVSTDSFVGVNSSPGYRKLHRDTVFLRKIITDPSTEVAKEPNGTEVPLSDLEDCAHFISCCLGNPPKESAGGLPIRNDNKATYGRLSASRLFSDLKDDQIITIMGKERMTEDQARERINARQIASGDLIFYYINNARDPGHVGIFLRTKGSTSSPKLRIACHTYCRCDVLDDYDQDWDSVRSATAYTLARID